ncbi:MAG: hypothetical protein COB37_11745 [Kordiimonadales bacterium]|nr:MAG: hypothetical protein COB37_11745 [Kordiimonadales bacterium]
MFVVFDLDGTLADHSHRHHHVMEEPQNWDAFFAECPADAPHPQVIAALHAHQKSGHRVEIWSGRSAVVKTETRQWLSKHGINPDLLKHMRPVDDLTADDTLKENWLRAATPRPDAVYEDRTLVVDMFRRNGIACFQVAPGDY